MNLKINKYQIWFFESIVITLLVGGEKELGSLSTNFISSESGFSWCNKFIIDWELIFSKFSRDLYIL